MIKTLEQLKNSNFSIVVKLWLDKVNGNTYHNVKIYINDKIYYTGFAYGYDRQCIDTALNYLFENNIIEKNENMKSSKTRWYIEKQAFIYSVKKEKQCRNNDF